MDRNDIETEFVHPPIPDRRFDWSATLKGYEPGDPVGRGHTEAAAIADLREQLAENAPDEFVDMLIGIAAAPWVKASEGS